MCENEQILLKNKRSSQIWTRPYARGVYSDSLIRALFLLDEPATFSINEKNYCWGVFLIQPGRLVPLASRPLPRQVQSLFYCSSSSFYVLQSQLERAKTMN